MKVADDKVEQPGWQRHYLAPSALTAPEGEAEALEYLRGLGVEDSGVHALIRAVYHLLGLRTFLTTGEKETRAWTIHAGDKASAAAGAVKDRTSDLIGSPSKGQNTGPNQPTSNCPGPQRSAPSCSAPSPARQRDCPYRP